MGALILILVGAGSLAVGIGGIIQGHANALDDPDSRNFAIAFWLFLFLGIWNMAIQGNPDGSYGWAFWIYAIIAVPCIILNLIKAFAR